MSPIRRRKEEEWETIVSNRKSAGTMLLMDDEFDCPECGDMIDFDDFIDGDEPYGCPSCGRSLL